MSAAEAAIWDFPMGSVDHVVEVARCLGYCNAAFVASYGDFMDSPVTAKNELTVSAWSKAKEVGAAFLEALQAYDANLARESSTGSPDWVERLAALRDVIAEVDSTTVEYLRGVHDGIELARRLVISQAPRYPPERLMNLLDIAQDHARSDIAEASRPGKQRVDAIDAAEQPTGDEQ